LKEDSSTKRKIKHQLVLLIGQTRIFKNRLNIAILWETIKHIVSLRYIENFDMPTDRI